MPRPSFLITVNVEADRLDQRPLLLTTKNSRCLPRLQTLCEAFGFLPTYLVSYEMASCPQFVEFGRDVLRRNAGEIGAHLHGWTCPPFRTLTADDHFHQPYITDWGKQPMWEKLHALTSKLENEFEHDIVTHRSGRWALNNRYVKMLRKRGYKVDCSVTPFVSWRKVPGIPGGRGGSNYQTFPYNEYFVDVDNYRMPGESSLLEVPVTIRPVYKNRIAPASMYSLQRMALTYVHRATRRLFPSVAWMRPNGKNLMTLFQLVEESELSEQNYMQLVLSSSDLMEGGDPKSEDAIFNDIEQLFARASTGFKGATMSDFYDEQHLDLQTPVLELV